jgi:hypothetical protein
LAKISMDGSEMSFRKHRGGISPADAERAWFAGLLRRAFPEATSENELAELAAEVLTSTARPVTARAVRNWLRQENTPHFRYVLAVIGLAGSEAVFQIIDPERPA